jgi:hypothetical protein
MKKIVSISIVLLLLSAATIAQSGPDSNIRRHSVREGFSNRQITRGERFELRKDVLRYKAAERNARRDGKITPIERRRLHKMKQHTRRDAFRFKHNRRHRII